MEYGLIGEKLPHSFSAVIHGMIGDYGYKLTELTAEELEPFMKAKDFKGINVTIPYKQAVMPYLDYISDEAKQIGAVNTVVNRGGKLYGYNTDIGGLLALIRRTGCKAAEKVLILGTGGTSRTAYHAAKALGAREIYKVSRSARDGALSYGEALAAHTDASLIINTTPCGMFPDIDKVPIDLAPFKNARAVVDVVYNPLRTRLVQEAQSLGLKAEGGLYMLVKQAVIASELFFDTKYDESITDYIYKRLLSQKENVVLTGMPASGKSTVGALLAAATNRPFYDSDEGIKQKCGMEIPDIFLQYGEEYFRSVETAVIKELSANSGCIIATGGGAAMRSENVRALKQNGHIYFLDRPIEQLIPTKDRPLAGTVEAIKQRYNERYDTYVSTADTVIKIQGNAQSVADEIERRHFS